MKKEVFRGIGTAMITPMTEKGVDYAAMERLIERQLEAGIDALIICATTGEAFIEAASVGKKGLLTRWA